MTWQFWAAYCDEAYAVLSMDFLKADPANPHDPVAPSGFDLAALQVDLKAVVG